MASDSIHLSSTANPIPSPPSIPTWSDRTPFLTAFSPDGALAAVARIEGGTITIVDLKSGDRRLVVETGMPTVALGVTGSTLLAVGDGKVVTWTIPTGDHVFNARANINGSVRTTILDQPGLPPGRWSLYTSISPGHDRVAVRTDGRPQRLRISDISTGTLLGDIEASAFALPRFTPDGCEVWVGNFSRKKGEGWAIIENEVSGLIQLEPLEAAAYPSELHGLSSRDHYVHDGWVLNSTQERIFWLPHRWRSPNREWGGRFLGLVDGALPEAVIVELCD